MREEEELKSF